MQMYMKGYPRGLDEPTVLRIATDVLSGEGWE
jgi:hypothetical protein